MARSIHEQWHVYRPDYIPEGEEHKHPHIGGIFHDYIPEGKQGIDLHGLTADATPKEPASEEVTEPDPAPNKSGTKSNKA